MSDIIYADVTFASGYSCKSCVTCCFMRVEKKPFDAVPLDIDWSSVSGSKIEPMDMIKSVEYLATDSSGCDLPLDCNDEPTVGATHIMSRAGRIGRRTATGPFTSARLWGGDSNHSYTLHILVTYERCGHCYDQTFCVDVLVQDC